MDLRSAIALGFAGGFAVTATPALAVKAVDKSTRTRLDTQAPGEPTSTPAQAWPQDGGVPDQTRRIGRTADR